MSYDALAAVVGGGDGDWRDDERLAAQVPLQVDVQAKYTGYIDRQHDEIERQRRNEETRLPDDLDYAEVRGLSNEVRQRLVEQRPATLGQAARIPGRDAGGGIAAAHPSQARATLAPAQPSPLRSARACGRVDMLHDRSIRTLDRASRAALGGRRSCWLSLPAVAATASAQPADRRTGDQG